MRGCPQCDGPVPRNRNQYWCDDCRGTDEWSEFFRMQRVAASRVSHAMRTGLLPKVPSATLKCVDCGDLAWCYDHRDYSRPLAVDPVCTSCNKLRGPATATYAAIRMIPSPGPGTSHAD